MRNQQFSTDQQLKEDWIKFHESGEFIRMTKHGFTRESIFKIFEAGWWAGRVAQLNHRPLKQIS
jgi:hypothetical protein